MNEVSLYIPCFNAAGTIGACLEGVFKQTYHLKEVLIIDDGSTDKTAAIASKYPVRIISHKGNRGIAAARNTGVRNIDTEFIASLDADCLSDRNWLERLMERFSSPKIAGAGGRLLDDYSSSVFDAWRAVHMKQYWETQKEKIRPPFLFGSNTVFRRNAIEKVGFYDERYKSNYEDVDISNRLKKARYSLAYEPKATARHLKSDNFFTLLNNYWRWNIIYYQREGHYSTAGRFLLKIKDNLGLANRYIEEDMASGRDELIYLDFFLGLYHSLRDFEYFISQDGQGKYNSVHSPLSAGIALVDLTFFYHFNYPEKSSSTLIAHKDALLQNFLALNIIVGRLIRENFKDHNFQSMLYKHLFLSVYRINNPCLVDMLLNMTELNRDWQGLWEKKHLNLNSAFLKNMYLDLHNWLCRLKHQFPGITNLIEKDAEMADKEAVSGKEARDV